MNSAKRFSGYQNARNARLIRQLAKGKAVPNNRKGQETQTSKIVEEVGNETEQQIEKVVGQADNREQAVQDQNALGELATGEEAAGAHAAKGEATGDKADNASENAPEENKVNEEKQQAASDEEQIDEAEKAKEAQPDKEENQSPADAVNKKVEALKQEIDSLKAIKSIQKKINIVLVSVLALVLGTVAGYNSRKPKQEPQVDAVTMDAVLLDMDKKYKDHNERLTQLLALEKKEIEKLMAYRVASNSELLKREEEFKKMILKELEKGGLTDIPLKFLKIDQLTNRIKPEIVAKAGKFFHDENYKLSPALSKKADIESINKIIEKFAPHHAYTELSSTASISLAAKVGKNSQNSQSRAVILTMAIIEQYPDLAGQIEWQVTNDHFQPVITLEGKAYIVAPGGLRLLSEDAKSKSTAYALVPLDDLFRGYAGAKPEKIRLFNQDKVASGYWNQTDNLIAFNLGLDGKLGNYGTLEERLGVELSGGYAKEYIENQKKAADKGTGGQNAPGAQTTTRGAKSGGENAKTTIDELLTALNEILKERDLSKISDEQIIEEFLDEGCLNLSSLTFIDAATMRRLNKIILKNKIQQVEFQDPAVFPDDTVDEIVKTSARTIIIPLYARINRRLFEKIRSSGKHVQMSLQAITMRDDDLELVKKLSNVNIDIVDVPQDKNALQVRIELIKKLSGHLFAADEIFIQYFGAQPETFADWTHTHFSWYMANGSKIDFEKAKKRKDNEAQCLEICKNNNVDKRIICTEARQMHSICDARVKKLEEDSKKEGQRK